MNQLTVTKASGEKAPFSVEKLKTSLRRSGAAEAVIQDVLQELEPTLYEGISTKKIYKNAYAILKKESKPSAARYSLKKGIMQLGPSGFPFEKFVAELLKAQGYTTEIGIFVAGQCVQHEIDVIAARDGKRYMIECKYHNQHTTKSNVRIPMYIRSRFKDVEMEPGSGQGEVVRFHQAWVVTNTRFTDDAIRYATCMRLHLIGWDFPTKAGLKDMVDSYGLYPLTCLTTLSKAEKQELLDMRIVLCKELRHNKKPLARAGVKESHQQGVLDEVENLCGG
ncbi:restriction endonuclease [Pontibacter sp. E15-1]|uniref:restriction endonuclease n=1 Tax=Pontibacter sp. E15-1 TaxID=2919918 RepID=UPI001F4F76F2|nr:restriction endonuclease [Pontibacter sp. E15-1]MCJ8163391.1 restriction endonuclease [Pontibacter sp. E15-1]